MNDATGTTVKRGDRVVAFDSAGGDMEVGRILEMFHDPDILVIGVVDKYSPMALQHKRSTGRLHTLASRVMVLK